MGIPPDAFLRLHGRGDACIALAALLYTSPSSRHLHRYIVDVQGGPLACEQSVRMLKDVACVVGAMLAATESPPEKG